MSNTDINGIGLISGLTVFFGSFFPFVSDMSATIFLPTTYAILITASVVSIVALLSLYGVNMKTEGWYLIGGSILSIFTLVTYNMFTNYGSVGSGIGIGSFLCFIGSLGLMWAGIKGLDIG